MASPLLMNPGFYVQPMLDPHVAHRIAMISSQLVFESYDDAAGHLEALLAEVDPCLLVVQMRPRPVRAHVPGAPQPCQPIGFRLVSNDPAPVVAVADLVDALHEAAARLSMVGSDALEPITA